MVKGQISTGNTHFHTRITENTQRSIHPAQMDDAVWEKKTFFLFFIGKNGRSDFSEENFGGGAYEQTNEYRKNTENKTQNRWRSPEEKGGKWTFEKVVPLRMEREGEW